MIVLPQLGLCRSDLDFLWSIHFQPLQLDLQDAVIETRLDLVRIDPVRQLDRT
jgi:hypothetical protein